MTTHTKLAVGSEIQVTLDDQQVHRGVVQRLRARGGQGFVYAIGFDHAVPAVLKVPGPAGLVGNEVERRILGALPPHPNIVRLLGTTQIQGVDCPLLSWGHENPFLRLNDDSLRQATKNFRGLSPRTPLPATTAIEMIYEVLLALEHMHKSGFVHGDVKSANVLVEVEGSETRLSNYEYFNALQQRAYRTMVVDFGSTRSAEFLESMDHRDEAVAPPEFTPLYAPPEVFRGVGDSKGGPAVDVYQVGVMLYQWISGTPPYEHVAPGLVREGLSQRLVQVKEQERAGQLRPCDPIKLKAARQHDVVFAEAFAAQRLRDHFFEDVLTIIGFATAADPQSRPSISALRAEVERLFELERPKADHGLKIVTAWNPRWHLTRINRLSVASRVQDPEEPAEAQEFAPAVNRSELDTTSERSPHEADPREASGRQARQPSPREASGRQQRQPNPREASGRQQQQPPPGAARARPSSREAATSGQKRRPPSGASTSGRAPRARPNPAASGQHPVGPTAQARAQPQPQAQPQGHPQQSARNRRPPTRGPRVALIDDDKVALAVLARSLKRRGFRVRTFQDPESALNAISYDHPDAAIIDMHMPGMSGMDLVKQLSWRLNGRPFPLMILSAVEDEVALKEAYRHGVSDYLIKPVTEGELAVKLETAIKNHQQNHPDAIPRELAGFELLEETRRGEIASVYRVADRWGRFPDVVKSIKVLRPELGGVVEPLLRLRREIDVLARCQHPSVPPLHLSGTWGRLLFYVTDEAPGQTLGDTIREHGALGAEATIHIMRDVATALDYLHTEGWLLGDLTPERVGHGHDGSFSLLAFGCARYLKDRQRMDEAPPPPSRYLAPEWTSDPPLPDARSDLFALGVCALEACTGRPPPRPARGARPDFRGAAEKLGGDLGTLLASLLEPDPATRLSSARLLLDCLARL
ncbi:MAG: response regulator [Planctomycetota bacterium]